MRSQITRGLVLLGILAGAVVDLLVWHPRPGMAQAAGLVHPPTSQRAGPRINARISIDNFAFKPKELSVPVGAVVTWVNHDDAPHTATSMGGSKAFDSRALDTDDQFSFTFTKPGTYRYYCKIHTHMTGTVIVK